jgi:Smg protein
MVIKQSVVDVLMFLFEQYLGDDNEVIDERDHMQVRLEEVGFEDREIDLAFDWLEELATIRDDKDFAPLQKNSIRVFSEEEKDILNEDCRGFIMHLEQSGILAPVTWSN